MKISTLALTLAAAFAVNAHADSTVVNGPMSFNPIAASAYGMEADAGIATTPWVIPEGYVQSIVSDESDLDIYVANDWHDMNTVNETGKHAGRYLYRTHEVRGGAIGNDGNSLRIDGGSGGAVSVVDLKTGDRQGSRRPCRLGSAGRHRLDPVADRAVRRRSRHRCASRSRCARKPPAAWCMSSSWTSMTRCPPRA